MPRNNAAEGPGALGLKRIYQVAGLLFFGVGLLLVFRGQSLKIQGDFGPAPGFFPFWVGLVLSAMSLVWFAQVSVAPSAPMPVDFIPERPQLRALAIVILALIAFMLLLRPLGFNLAMLGLLLFLFFAAGRDHPVAKVVIALAGSFGLHSVFENVLKVPLPFSSFDALRQLGL